MAESYPPSTPPTPPGPPDMQPPGTAPPPPSGPPPAPALQPLPWEHPGYPMLEAIYETAKLFLTAPSQAFARMSITGDIGRPLLYAVIFGWVGIVANQAYSIALRGAMQGIMSGVPGYNPRLMFGLPVVVSVGVMIAAPIFVLIGAFIWAAIMHLFLMIAGGANTGFSSTLRVVCYSGTVQVFQVVPLCGGLIGLVWGLVLYIIGIAIAQRTTQGKAALAVLLPIALCCACIAVVFAVAGAAIMAAIGHARWH